MEKKSNSRLFYYDKWAILDPIMRRAFSKLNDPDKQLVKLYYYDELSIDEIAHRLSERPSAIRKRHLQIIKRLNKLIKQELRRSIKELESVKSPKSPNIQIGLRVVREALESIS